MPKGLFIFLIIGLVIGAFLLDPSKKMGETRFIEKLILDTREYQNEAVHAQDVWSVLKERVEIQPFNLVALIIFVCAILHTFFTHYFTVLSKKLRDKNIREGVANPNTFAVGILHFLGEVEVVFGIWVIPLMFSIFIYYDWHTALVYVESRSYAEPLFVIVIMTLAASKPLVLFAEGDLKFVAKLWGGGVKAWWWSILTCGPLTGSFITEPGAMTISALLLARQFYHYKPSMRLAYATLGLLFTNVSVGGVLTSYAAPPVLMVSKAWGWDTQFMATHFGWKAFLGIVISNLLYFLFFKKDFDEMEARQKDEKLQEKKEEKVPAWITLVHLVFLAWTVINVHHPIVFVGSFLLYMGFVEATKYYQNKLALKGPVLVGFFLAGLVMHGGLQGWWIGPILNMAKDNTLLFLAMFLTSFNDNAAITYLTSLVPGTSETTRYIIMVGAISAGGLTVIANAPNPAGQSTLNTYFPEGISAIYLFIGAFLPTVIMALTFILLKNVNF
jgi:hypothetical protein